MSSFATEASVQPLRVSSLCMFGTALQSSSPCVLHERFKCSVAALSALRCGTAKFHKLLAFLVPYRPLVQSRGFSNGIEAHSGLFLILAKLETAWRARMPGIGGWAEPEEQPERRPCTR